MILKTSVPAPQSVSLATTGSARRRNTRTKSPSKPKISRMGAISIFFSISDTANVMSGESHADMTVAIAAPRAPIAGMNPKPNMNA